MIANYLQRYDTDHFVNNIIAAFAWLDAVLFALVYFLSDDPDRILIVVPAAFAATGLAALFLPLPAEGHPERWAFLCYAGAIGLGLIAAGSADAWLWWVALAGAALLPISPDMAHKRSTNIYFILLLIGVVIGIVLAESRSQNWEHIVMGCGLMAIGGVLAARDPIPKGSRKINIHQTLEMEAVLPAMTIEDLAELSTRIHVTSDGLIRSTQAITDITTQQSDGAREQVDVLQQTNTMMEEFLTLSERVSEQARTMTQTAQQAATISQDGQQAIHEAIGGMQQIRGQVKAIATKIVTLAQLTRRIDEIITSVSEIATQSNLLALNASIEAARAGVHGRGFAIVADEVRSLSQQSTSAAHQVQGILAEIQNAVKQTISATESGMQEADEGVSKTQHADRTMMQLTENVNASNDAVREIYNVIRQQADGLEAIAINMERIDRISQQNITNTRMVDTVITNLNRLADELQNAVEVGRHTTEFSVPMEEL